MLKSSQRGNAVLMILIGVALFAALAYTFMRGSQQGSTSMSKQQAKIAAQEILDYTQAVERVVAKLLGRGCSENMLSFDYDIPAVTGYENPNAPADFSCHIFHSEGGKLAYAAPNAKWLDSSKATSSDYGKLIITGKSCVYGVGEITGQCASNDTESDQDLIIIIPYIRREICDSINAMMESGNADGTPSKDSGNSWAIGTYHFTGTFVDVSQIGTNTTAMSNKTTACYEGNANPPAGTYHFYNVLLVR